MKKILIMFGVTVLGMQTLNMMQQDNTEDEILNSSTEQREYANIAKAGNYEDFHIYMGSNDRIKKDAYYKNVAGALQETIDQNEANVWWDDVQKALIVKNVNIDKCVTDDGNINLSNKTRTFFANLASGKTYSEEISLNVHFYGDNVFDGCMYGLTTWDYPDSKDSKMFKHMVLESKEDAEVTFNSSYSGGFLESIVVTRNGKFNFFTTELKEAALHSTKNVIVDGSILHASSPLVGIRLADPSEQMKNIINGGRIEMVTTASTSYPFLGNYTSHYQPKFLEPDDAKFEKVTGIVTNRWTETEYIITTTPSAGRPKRVVLDGLISSNKEIIEQKLDKTNFTLSNEIDTKDKLIIELKKHVVANYNGAIITPDDIEITFVNDFDEMLGEHVINVVITYYNGVNTIKVENIYSITIQEPSKPTPTKDDKNDAIWWVITFASVAGLGIIIGIIRSRWIAAKGKDKVVIIKHKWNATNNQKVKEIKNELSMHYTVIVEKVMTYRKAKWFITLGSSNINDDEIMISRDRREEPKKTKINDIHNKMSEMK